MARLLRRCRWGCLRSVPGVFGGDELLQLTPVEEQATATGALIGIRFRS